MPETLPTSGVPWQTATVSAVATQTPRIKSFVLDVPTPIHFTAGQHVDVRLTAPDGYAAVRSYSIASAPEETHRIEIAVELLEDGEVSPFFHDVVQVGDVIEMSGPRGGHFVWKHGVDGPLLLIGGGSGVVPLLSMLRHRREVKSDTSALLLLSARTWGDVPFRDELLAMDEARDGFQLVLALTRDRGGRPGDYERRVDADMMRDVLRRLGVPRITFACGTNEFVDVAIDAAIASGLTTSMDIRTERYGG